MLGYEISSHLGVTAIDVERPIGEGVTNVEEGNFCMKLGVESATVERPKKEEELGRFLLTLEREDAMKRRMLFGLASVVLLCFAIQPALVALYTSPSRVVEAIPIDVTEETGLPSKDAVEKLRLPNVEWSIHVKGVALVTVAGDAIIQVSYTFREREACSTEWRTETGRVQVIAPRFVEYREAVEAFKRGEIDQPLPELLHQEKTRNSKLDDWGEFTTFDWYGFTFVAWPGSTKQWVKYNHPDNYYTYHPEEWNLHWDKCVKRPCPGWWAKQVIHYSQAEMGSIISTKSLWLAMLGLAGGIAAMGAALIGASNPVTTPTGIALEILAGVLGLIGAIGVAVEFVIEWVILAEQGDGWGYNHYSDCYSPAVRAYPLYISLGAWYDWLWWIGWWKSSPGPY